MVINTIIEVELDKLKEVSAASASRRGLVNDNQATVQITDTPTFEASACVCVHVACFPEGVV